jgi:hypothetical protein
MRCSLHRPAAADFAPVDATAPWRATFCEPLWIDVEDEVDAEELRVALATASANVAPDVIERFLAGCRVSEDEAVTSTASARRVWAFAAETTSSDEDETFSVCLQPVSLLVSDGLVLTRRRPGIRVHITPPEGQEVGEPIPLARMRQEAELAWRRWPQEDGADRDLLLLSLIQGVVQTHFVARAEIAQEKARVDADFFHDLAAIRRRTAERHPTVDQVADLAAEASAIIDGARLRLTAIQALVVDYRSSFDGLKPPGRDDLSVFWLGESRRAVECERVVTRIYQVRNDLRGIRHDVHSSMALLASADTGGQLLAVRALLDRTESARRAGIIAATFALLVASVALIAAIAAIPGAGTRFALSESAGAGGFLVLAAAFVGFAVAATAGRRGKSPLGVIASSVATVLGVVGVAGFALTFAGAGFTESAMLTAAIAFSLAALVLFAYFADLGERGFSVPEVDAAECLVRSAGGRWSGTPEELDAELRRIAGSRAQPGLWPQTSEDLVLRLRANEALLRARGVRIAGRRRIQMVVTPSGSGRRAQVPPR